MRTETPWVTCSRITEYGAVRHLARDLDAAVHRPGVHDDDVVLGRLQPLGGEAEELEVLA